MPTINPERRLLIEQSPTRGSCIVRSADKHLAGDRDERAVLKVRLCPIWGQSGVSVLKGSVAQRFCFTSLFWQRGFDDDSVMKINQICGLVIAVCVAVPMASADSLQLNNGSLINGTFMGGTESEISFQVGSSVQTYDRAAIVSLKFESETAADALQTRPTSSPLNDSGTTPPAQIPAFFTLPPGTPLPLR